MKLKLRTKEYEIRSLTFADVEKFAEDGTLDKLPTVESARNAMFVKANRDAMLLALCHAIGVSREELVRELDLENIADAIGALTAVSRLSRKEAGAGEAKPQTP